MTRTEHLLTIAAEECMEVAQRISKALRFGLDEIQPGQELTNAQRIMVEYNDLYAMIAMLAVDHGDIAFDIESPEIPAKIAKVEKFLAYSVECGTLEDR